jgi:hypothetical protein
MSLNADTARHCQLARHATAPVRMSRAQDVKSTEHRKSTRNTADVQADNPTSTSTPSPAIAIQTQSSARCTRQSHGRSPWRSWTQPGTMMKLNPSTRRRDARTLRPTLACCSRWASTLQVLLWAPNSHVSISPSSGSRAAASHWPCVTQELGLSKSTSVALDHVPAHCMLFRALLGHPTER